MPARSDTVTSLHGLIRHHLPHYAVILLHSTFIALLALTPFLYMMQIRERVYLSRSWETLGFITLLVVGLMLVWALLIWLRGAALRAIGARIDTRLRSRVFEAIQRARPKNPFAYFHDVVTLRNGLTGNFIASVFDALLSPLFIAVLFILHPVFGWVCLAFLATIGLLTALSARLGAKAKKDTKPLENTALAFGMASTAKPDVIDSMHMLPGVRGKWSALQTEASEAHYRTQSITGIVDTILSLLRRSELIVIIGTGAVLYLMDEITAGIAFAAFIVMMRGVNPVLAVVQNWSTVGDTRAAYDRLDALLEAHPDTHVPSPGKITGAVTCRNLSLMGPGGKPILRNISFDLPAGTCLGVIGPSGAGKSSLLRLLAGSRTPHTGEIAVDGFALSDWPEAQIGQARGFLPQEVDLFPGTIWENIARFEAYNDTSNQAVLNALAASGAMEIVQNRPDGLSTPLADGGAPLSGGQRQRIGLARALYREPRLIILDEPNAALDAAGEAALANAIVTCKSRGATVMFSTHKANLLEYCDYLLVMMDGYVHSFSTRDDILDRLDRGGARLIEAADK